MTNYANRGSHASRDCEGPRSLLRRLGHRTAFSLASSSGPIAYALLHWWAHTH